jgi:hypothetical protein
LAAGSAANTQYLPKNRLAVTTTATMAMNLNRRNEIAKRLLKFAALDTIRPITYNPARPGPH